MQCVLKPFTGPSCIFCIQPKDVFIGYDLKLSEPQ